MSYMYKPTETTSCGVIVVISNDIVTIDKCLQRNNAGTNFQN